MTRILNQPLQATTSYIPGSQSNAKCSAEILMLFWEVTQCNKRFRSFIIDTDRSHDFVILILFYALEYKLDASKQGIVRMCIFLLVSLNFYFGGCPHSSSLRWASAAKHSALFRLSPSKSFKRSFSLLPYGHRHRSLRNTSISNEARRLCFIRPRCLSVS
jgi:hypothetical protein